MKKIWGDIWGKIKGFAKKKSGKIIIVAAAAVIVIAVTAMIILSQTLWKINHVSGYDEGVGAISRQVNMIEEAVLDAYDEKQAEQTEESAKRAEIVKKAEAEISEKLKGVDIDVMHSENIKNILLIGQDKRSYEKEAQRSDSMIIASINTDTKKITLCSLMRDMYVPIPGYKDNRINESYQYGGMKLLDQTIEEALGVHIDGNVEVDFDGFKEIFSYVGPVRIEIKDYEVNHLNKIDSNWHITEGWNDLTGEQALAYARTRKVGNSDWERTDRQRRVLAAAFDNIKEMDMFSLIELVSKICPYITTDMTNSEMMGYAYLMAKEHLTMGESLRFPMEGTYTCETLRRGMEVLVPDLEANSELLKEYLYGN